MRFYTIGFTRKTAEDFFSRLRIAQVRRILDIRLNNVSQLAGFAKKEDLRFFLKELCGADYLHLPDLAPTQDLLAQYRQKDGAWATYESAFLALMASRAVEDVPHRELFDDACLLCSEDQPDQCHRRLVAEYLSEHWGDVDIIHL